MADIEDLLIEIGTEELPPKILRRLSEDFARGVVSGLGSKGLTHDNVQIFATPRRLAVLLKGVPASLPNREIERRGPALNVAFDAQGRATQAAEGFARSCGTSVHALSRVESDDGAWLVYRTTEIGDATVSLVPELVNEVLAKLPAPRRMRWGTLNADFVRPVHWILMMYGTSPIEAEILGVKSTAATHGHRFHHPEAIPIQRADAYAATLQGQGQVIAQLQQRKDTIRSQVAEIASEFNGHALLDEPLLEETAALVEWPIAIAGEFDERFLELPDPVLIATMRGHQRYFPIASTGGKLLPHFVTIANIESTNPDTIRRGNERVIRPRLSDAAFFYKSDLGQSLEARRVALKEVVFQEKLGSLYDKTERASRLAGIVSIAMGETPDGVKHARRAGVLFKSDLLTRMVREFPELQGVMGRCYALKDGEHEATALAIEESYRPRFAGDRLPTSNTGRALALADKLDTLVGIFGIDQGPTGDKDPYGLRRSALGALRIMIEAELKLDLNKLLNSAAEGFPQLDKPKVRENVHAFMQERLRAYFVDQGVPVDVYAAVQARQPTVPLDFARRVWAVDKFRKMPEAGSLAAANKRIKNILRQADVDSTVPVTIDDTLFAHDSEWNLAAKVIGLGPQVWKQLREGDYTSAMSSLASLRDNVDEFFNNVKIMDDNERVRNNRLALLYNISTMFMETADISKLQTTRN